VFGIKIEVIFLEAIRFIQTFSSPFLDKIFIGITMLGEDYFFILIVAALFWCVRKDWGYRLGLAYLSSSVLNVTLKEVFRVPRPIGQPGIRSLRLETAGGFSFPSGHTQSITVLLSTLAFRIKRTRMYIASALIIILVAISRMYLGVHTPADVIAGAIIGIGWAFAINWLFDYAERKSSAYKQTQIIFILLGVLLLVGLWFFAVPNYFKAAGSALGLLTGYFIEPRFIRYEPKARLGKQMIKYSLGIAVLLGIEIYVKKLWPDQLISHFLRYYLMGVWVTIGAPVFFKVILREKTGPV
jgi:membrane-associated phospholipid phosphatase